MLLMLWQILINNAHLSKSPFSYFEISSYVHKHSFAANFLPLGLSVIYPKYQLHANFPLCNHMLSWGVL